MRGRAPAPADLPADFLARCLREDRRRGTRHFPALLDLLARALEHWGLDWDGALATGHTGCVLFATDRAGRARAVKAGCPHPEVLTEPHALRHWDGSGAVPLLDTFGGDRVLLLPRLDLPQGWERAAMPHVFAAWADVARRLTATPAAPLGFPAPTVAGTVRRWLAEFPAALGDPLLPEHWKPLVRVASATGRRLLEDGRLDARRVLHTDLHPGNMMMLGDAWVAIDPQCQVGPAEFMVAPMLWNRLDAYPPDDGGPAVRARCAGLSRAAGLDPDLAAALSLLREVDNLLDYHRTGDLDDARRSRWVASALAGQDSGIKARHVPRVGG